MDFSGGFAYGAQYEFSGNFWGISGRHRFSGKSGIEVVSGEFGLEAFSCHSLHRLQ